MLLSLGFPKEEKFCIVFSFTHECGGMNGAIALL